MGVDVILEGYVPSNSEPGAGIPLGWIFNCGSWAGLKKRNMDHTVPCVGLFFNRIKEWRIFLLLHSHRVKKKGEREGES